MYPLGLPSRRVKMVYSMLGGITVSCQWLLHGFYPYWIFTTIFVVWMVLLLLQQVSPMDEVFFGEFQLFSWSW